MVTASKVFTENDKYDTDEAGELAWKVTEAEGELEELSLTNEELTEKIAAMQELYNVVKNSTPADTDVTHLIVNRDFSLSTGGEQDWNGWVKEAVSGGNVRALASAKCAEAWNNGGFDIYQIIRDLPVGMYEVQSQGFYRYLRGDNAWNACTHFSMRVNFEVLQNVAQPSTL